MAAARRRRPVKFAALGVNDPHAKSAHCRCHHRVSVGCKRGVLDRGVTAFYTYLHSHHHRNTHHTTMHAHTIRVHPISAPLHRQHTVRRLLHTCRSSAPTVLHPTSGCAVRHHVVPSVSHVRHHAPPERLHHLVLPFPHTAHPPQLHHVRQRRRTRRLGFIASSVAQRPAVAAAPRGAQQRHGRHTSTNTGLSTDTEVLQQGVVVEEGVAAFDVIGEGVVEVGQVVVAIQRLQAEDGKGLEGLGQLFGPVLGKFGGC